MADRVITVEVVYAGTESCIRRHRLELREGNTVICAVESCAMALSLPPGAVDPTRLGIFGRKVTPDQLLHDGDRIEVYRPLVLDPMEARRRRAR